MPSIINIDNGQISGTPAVRITAAGDGVLEIQNSGNVALTVNAEGTIVLSDCVANSISSSAIITGTLESEEIRSTGSAIVNGSAYVGTSSGVYSYSTIRLHVNGSIASTNGNHCRTGLNGVFRNNVFWIDWTGTAARCYIDATNVGTFTFTSDYRIKRNVNNVTESGIDRVMKLRPVSYQHKNFNIVKQTEEIREGFIAHEVAEIIPSAVDGEKDSSEQLQSLRLDALCSVMAKAIQELKVELDSANLRIQELEQRINVSNG